MDKLALLRRYDAEVRDEPRAQPGIRVERTPQLTRLTGGFNMLVTWRCAAHEAQALVNAQAEEFRARGEPLIWKVCGHDRPQLGAELARAGFVLQGRESLMALDVAQAITASWATPRHEVRRVHELAGLDDFMRVSEAAFGTAEPWRRAAYAGRLQERELGLLVAYHAGQPVAAGRLELVANDFFGELFGGGVVPAARGQGVYTSLVAARLKAAHAAGVPWLTVGGNANSAPRLLRLGFVELSPTECWVLSAD
ncbi:MAG TPA: GNAT family N-acetyltransferase [Polyangiales bacterium]